MVYFISTFSLLLLVTVDAYELDEITYLPHNYWSIMKYATTPAAYSSVPFIKRQGIIPGPRVGRSFALPYDHYHQLITSESTNNNDNNNLNSDNVKSKNVNNNKYNNKYDSLDNFHPELHDLQSLTGFNSRGKRSLRLSDIASAASSSSASNPSPSSSTGSAVDMASIEDSQSPQSMVTYSRSTRQLIPAPRVGRSSPSSLSSPYLSSNLLTGLSQQASTYRTSDDEVNSYEGDQQLGYTSLGTHGGIQLLAVPRNYLNPFIAKDLFKRVALTPRIGRSDGSSIGSKGWLDDDDYYNRIIKSSFTPRVGRSVDAVNGEKSMKSSKP